MVYHLIIVRYSMKTLHWYFPWATASHLYNMTGRGEKLQQLHCYHPLSDSLDIYLTKNHYENYSPKMVPIAKIWGSGSWTNIYICLYFAGYTCSKCYQYPMLWLAREHWPFIWLMDGCLYRNGRLKDTRLSEWLQHKTVSRHLWPYLMIIAYLFITVSPISYMDFSARSRYLGHGLEITSHRKLWNMIDKPFLNTWFWQLSPNLSAS